jgi:excisionase family DNA binding protein
VIQHSGGDALKNGQPAFVRVGEAAVILGISKSAAYELANAWLATEGQAGLPAVRMGRCILVPRAALERLAAVGTERNNVGLVG